MANIPVMRVVLAESQTKLLMQVKIDHADWFAFSC